MRPSWQTGFWCTNLARIASESVYVVIHPFHGGHNILDLIVGGVVLQERNAISDTISARIASSKYRPPAKRSSAVIDSDKDYRLVLYRQHRIVIGVLRTHKCDASVQKGVRQEIAISQFERASMTADISTSRLML